MNLDTVITRQQGVEAMQYLIANATDDTFMHYAAHYLYENFKLGYKQNCAIPEGISAMIDIFIKQDKYVKDKPAFLLTDAEHQLIRRQFAKALIPDL